MASSSSSIITTNPASAISENHATDSSQSSTIAPILRLPPELFSHFLDHVPPPLLQRTALALHRVFPDARVAEEYLWRYVTVRKGEQSVPLWHAARKRRDRIAQRVEDGDRAGSASVRVRGFVVESWRGDADILNNALRCLPDIPVLQLNMGTNFAPEHLAEMFETHRPTLNRLELRFRPYVEQATYYQFLKGSYFDTAIEMLTHKWPESPSFTKIAIVQDLPPRVKPVAPTPLPGVSPGPSTAAPTAANSTAASSAVPSTTVSSANSPSSGPTALSSDVAALDLDSEDEAQTAATSVSDTPIVQSRGYSGHGPFPYLGDKLAWAKPKTFAQPIVFFDIRCITRFGVSPSARHLTHLRLRVPSRDVVSVLISPQPRMLFPSLKYLDISTTNVRLDANLAHLFKQYETLEHLVLDRVNLFGFQAKEKGADMCRNLGGMIPSACLARGKERERAIVAWDVADRQRMAVAQAEAVARANTGGRSGGGGGGNVGGSVVETPLEQANRLAREAAEERDRQLSLARARRTHRSAAMSGFSMRDSPRRSSLSASTSRLTSIPGITLGPADRLYLVLPPLPSVRTISVGGEARLNPIQIREWTAEFHSGWKESLGKVMGWAGHVGERYERAKRKAEEWAVQELKQSSGGGGSGGGNGKGKNKASGAGTGGKGASTSSTSNTPSANRPPTDIRLYRYPLASEPPINPGKPYDPLNPLAGLIQLDPQGKDYLDPYRQAMADAELYANDNSFEPPCVFCTVPDCEGPARRGDEGGKVDGRGGMEGTHVRGCGHGVGRGTWGWEGM